jgi:hypothetical protein
MLIKKVQGILYGTMKTSTGIVVIALLSLTIGTGIHITQAQNTTDLQAQILEAKRQVEALQAQITAHRTLLPPPSSSSVMISCGFQRDLRVGMSGEDVHNLQKLLNSNTSTQVASAGPGSKGLETTTFGPLTASAVSKFQELYASHILSPLGLMRGTGIFGPSTRTHAEKICLTMKSALGERGTNPNPSYGQAFLTPVSPTPIPPPPSTPTSNVPPLSNDRIAADLQSGNFDVSLRELEQISQPRTLDEALTRLFVGENASTELKEEVSLLIASTFPSSVLSMGTLDEVMLFIFTNQHFSNQLQTLLTNYAIKKASN